MNTFLLSVALTESVLHLGYYYFKRWIATVGRFDRSVEIIKRIDNIKSRKRMRHIF